MDEVKVKLYLIDIDYSTYGHYKEYARKYKLTEKAAELIPSIVMHDKFEAPEEGQDGYVSRTICDSGTLWLTGEEYLALVELMDCRVKQTATKRIGLHHIMQHVAGKEQVQLTQGGETTYNQQCEVHMPSQALATYNETLLLEDSCTDALQESLAKGWRIIAACPQPDQRRPDYILGRFNPGSLEQSAGRRP